MAPKDSTVREVASRAGVSIATVSRVARGIGQVAPETRRRVLLAIDELEYRPSHLGRALVARRHAALGIVFPGLSGPYYSEVIHGFEAEAVGARQSVLILGTHLLGHADEQVREMARRVDGLAIFGGTVAEATIAKLVADRVPTVLLAGHPLPGVPTVRAENVGATTALTLHLLRTHGYERLAFVGNPVGSPDVGDRWLGFVVAHRHAGIAPPPEPIRVGMGQADGLVAAARLLDGDRPPRAIVCANDETALGVYGAATARGVRIPDELAVTGWDDIPLARLVSPSLTTVRQPMRDLGTRTARLLLARIRGVGEDGEDGDEAPDVVLPTEPVLRASCGCAVEGAPVPGDPTGSRHRAPSERG